jgi:histidinol-phosphate aminotransferase
MKIKKSIRDLIPYPPGKPIEELTREYGIKKVIKLASNENPLGSSPLALKAIRKGLSQLHRYPDGSGYYLKEGLSRQLGVKSEQVLLGNGSNEIIELALRCFLSPGDEVVSPSPSFLVYGTAVQAVGGRNILVPLKQFTINLESMLQAISPRTRIIIVNNPNNPTGTIIKRKNWEKFLKALPPDILILLDEAYIDFVDDPDCPDGLEYLASDKALLVLRTFSKAYGLAGLRIGYGVTRADLADYMNRVRQPFNVNSLGQAGALGALGDREFFEKTRSLVREGKLVLERGLKKLGLPYIPTQTNFILIKLPRKAQEVFEAMLHKGVIIRSMKSYGLEDYIRVNMGLPEENRLFLKALKEVLSA